jgi:hypothetical protein
MGITIKYYLQCWRTKNRVMEKQGVQPRTEKQFYLESKYDNDVSVHLQTSRLPSTHPYKWQWYLACDIADTSGH